ncbi:LacI family DNA-binding transcriptional regulator [Microbacterium sp. RD1]|uniref:LacI family DNA-binding transcriptional regulator n=1 Tax=Microbacterium sp. RD1 TaxID=3457313 RepID=UPI003FA5CCF4
MSGKDGTIYQVAERAGVSISTVSLAINHPDRVRPATLDRIMTVVDELGFVPKEQAVARARVGVGRIVVVAPFTSYPTYLRRLQGVLSEVGRDGTQVIVHDHEDLALAQSPLLGSIPVKGHVDGIIIMDMVIEEKIRARLSNRLPTVLIGTIAQGLPRVDIDNFDGGRLVGRRLADWGHRRVAFVREAQPNLFRGSPTELRLEGLTSVLGKNNVVDVGVPRDETGGVEAIRLLFDEVNRDGWPTAVFATRDIVALRVWRAARDAGLRVPEDLSIVGFDDDPTMEAIGLTTVRNPLEETGAAALRMLRRRLGGESPEDVRLPVEFIERQTAGPASSGGHVA